MLQMPQTSIHSILPATLTYGQQIDIPSSPVPASAALTITAFSNLFFDAMSPEPVPVRPLKCRSVFPEGFLLLLIVNDTATKVNSFMSQVNPLLQHPRRHPPHGNLKVLEAPAVSFGNTVNFFLLVIQETPLRAAGPDD